MPNNTGAIERRRNMRVWIEDFSRKEGGYWFAASQPLEKHGKVWSVYTNWFCRCRPCQESNRKHNEDFRAKQQEKKNGNFANPQNL